MASKWAFALAGGAGVYFTAVYASMVYLKSTKISQARSRVSLCNGAWSATCAALSDVGAVRCCGTTIAHAQCLCQASTFTHCLARCQLRLARQCIAPPLHAQPRATAANSFLASILAAKFLLASAASNFSCITWAAKWPRHAAGNSQRSTRGGLLPCMRF